MRPLPVERATTLTSQLFVAVEDGGLTALDGHIHAQTSFAGTSWVVRGKPAICVAVARSTSTPRV